MATTQEVQALYIGLLGRAADQAGLNFWIQDIASGNRTLDDVREAFAASPEFASTYGGLTDRTDLVSTIYANLFERAPDAEGLAYWVGTSLTADELIAAFITYASPADRTVLNNKVLVAEVYTNVAGTDGFNTTDAATIVADVDGTLGSVTGALGNITSLPGVVAPATVAAIKALETTTASLTSFETNKANVDALVALQAKLVALDAKYNLPGSVPALVDGDASGVAGDSYAEAAQAISTAVALRGNLSNQATNVIQAQADNLAADVATAKQALIVALPGAAGLIKTFEAAAVADLTTRGADNVAVTAAVNALAGQAGVDTAKWDAALVAAGLTAGDTAQDVYDFLADEGNTDAEIATFKQKFADSTLSNFAKTAFNEAATLAAQDRADDIANTKASDAAAALGNSPAATDYLSAFGTNLQAQAGLAAVKEADALKAEAEALKAAHDALTSAVITAQGNVAGSAAVDLVANVGAGPVTADVFYFDDGAKTADDFAITFGAGDSLYLGQGFTFNAGALTAGNGNAQEFFLVQNGADTQVVIETTKFGSATTTVDANGAVTASPDAAVIILTGVSIDNVSVSNGLISYVA